MKRILPEPGLLTLDLTAMIDVIFLLLIFWMMFTSLQARPVDRRIVTPVSDIPAGSAPGELCTIELQAEGDVVMIAGEAVAIAELAGAVSARGPAGVLVRAAGEADSVRVRGVLGALRLAGVQQVGLAIREPGR